MGILLLGAKELSAMRFMSESYKTNLSKGRKLHTFLVNLSCDFTGEDRTVSMRKIGLALFFFIIMCTEPEFKTLFYVLRRQIMLSMSTSGRGKGKINRIVCYIDR